MKISTGRPDREDRANGHKLLYPGSSGAHHSSASSSKGNHAPAIFLGAMVAAILLMDAVLPLRGLWFHEALLTQFGSWPVWPTLFLFSGLAIIPPLPFMQVSGTPELLQSWAEFPLLFGAFIVVFLVYFAGLSRLPERISWRFLFRSTILLGLLCALIPIVTSPDIYSYIAYARMGVLHGLNPLTTLPTAIHGDPIYNYVLWPDQPSAYGPAWIVITGSMQWALARLGMSAVPPMLIALRLLGLGMHLASVQLIWSITGKLQLLRGRNTPYPPRERLCATLAFAWNPLLLFEACVNAHIDTTILVFVLLVIGALAKNRLAAAVERDRVEEVVGPKGAHKGPYPAPPDPRLYYDDEVVGRAVLSRGGGRGGDGQGPLRAPFGLSIPADLRAPVAASSLLALATCLRINIALFFPGLLFYLWVRAPAGRRFRHIAAASISYLGLIVIAYAPFWQGGALLEVFTYNPAASRSINSVADFLGHAYNGIAAMFGYPLGEPIGSPAERFFHVLSIGIFVLIYLFMLWRMVRFGRRMRTLDGLIYWMAVAWLLYCAVGSPWFWPWYLVTFFGLYALVESGKSEGRGETSEREGKSPGKHMFRTPWTVRLLSFSMLGLYCFITWGPAHSFVPGVPGFLWTYLSGVWAWMLPLAGLALFTRIASLRRFLNHFLSSA